MIRDADLLKATMRKKAFAVHDACAKMGFELLIYCTERCPRQQAILYRMGRPIRQIRKKAQQLAEYNPAMAQLLMDVGPQQGHKVTNAGPGQSLHQYGWAFDAVPLLHGKAIWESDHPYFQDYGRAVRDAKLEWAGDWRFKEYFHAQMPGKDWREMIKTLKA